MRGPSPVPGSRNANKVDWVVLPAEGRQGKPPTLPSGRRWLKATRDYWAWLWSTPQATQWDEADKVLVRLALLVDLVYAEKASSTHLTEIRNIECSYGLNPKALIQLRWRIAPGGAEVVSPASVDDQLAERRASRRKRVVGE